MKTQTPEQLRLSTIITLAAAFQAQLKVTATWRPGDIMKAMEMPGTARVAWLLR